MLEAAVEAGQPYPSSAVGCADAEGPESDGHTPRSRYFRLNRGRYTEPAGSVWTYPLPYAQGEGETTRLSNCLRARRASPPRSPLSSSSSLAVKPATSQGKFTAPPGVRCPYDPKTTNPIRDDALSCAMGSTLRLSPSDSAFTMLRILKHPTIKALIRLWHCGSLNRRSLRLRALFCRGKRIAGRENVCEDYAIARLDLANGAVVDLACSWHLHGGRDVIRVVFYGTEGAVAMGNKDGSFLDFFVKDLPEPHAFYSADRRMSGVDEPLWIGRGASHGAAATIRGRTKSQSDAGARRNLEHAGNYKDSTANRSGWL